MHEKRWRVRMARERANEFMWDVLVIGGGPAGLSAALLLGRCNRNVLVCDSGKPRNAVSRAVHGYLSRDGIAPAEFLQLCREQLQSYPSVQWCSGEVTRAERVEGIFHVTVGGDFTARAGKLLLATGIADILPDFPGFSDFYGLQIHHCPYCDGWEHKGQSLGILGGGNRECDLALELLTWSHDLILFSNGARVGASSAVLMANRIQIIEAPITRFEGENGKLNGVRLQDGRIILREALFFYPRQQQRSRIAEALGCRFNADEAIECANAQTGVDGVYAAGNTSRGLQLVITAAAEGAQAAYAINEALAAEALIPR